MNMLSLSLGLPFGTQSAPPPPPGDPFTADTELYTADTELFTADATVI